MEIQDYALGEQQIIFYCLVLNAAVLNVDFASGDILCVVGCMASCKQVTHSQLSQEVFGAFGG